MCTQKLLDTEQFVLPFSVQLYFVLLDNYGMIFSLKVIFSFKLLCLNNILVIVHVNVRLTSIIIAHGNAASHQEFCKLQYYTTILQPVMIF